MLDAGEEHAAVDGAIEQAWRDGAIGAQSRDEGGRLPGTPLYRLDQSLMTRRSTIKPGHIRLAPGFINENQLAERRALLVVAPHLAGFGDIGTVLLSRPERLFLSVSPSVARVFQTTPVLTVILMRGQKPGLQIFDCRVRLRCYPDRIAKIGQLGPYMTALRKRRRHTSAPSPGQDFRDIGYCNPKQGRNATHRFAVVRRRKHALP